tara:strand:+ start:305 stop:955 length:651 start_codon:yes stop_codon:yes gene_type:complete
MNIQNNLTIPIKTLKQAKELIGGYTVTSKMPTISYSISAKDCITGSKLRLIKNTVCSDCYALKGNYIRYAKNIEPSQKRRLESISSPNWVNAMVYIMHNQKDVIRTGLFRWHDSGDIQSLEHLQKIVDIAKATPNVKHWLPTKESNLIQNFKGAIPKNLIIRLSGSFIDGKEPKYKNTSTVVSDKRKATCNAINGKCLTCSDCWNSSIKNVSYLNH